MSQEFIGAGERTTVNILRGFFSLDILNNDQWPRDGIYTQVPIQKLIKKSFFDELSAAHQKGSIDVAMTIGDRVFLFRVQNQGGKYGHGSGSKGLGKSKHDIVQKNFLDDAGCHVIDLWQVECPQLFQEKFNFVSIWEVANAMISANIRPSMVKI